MKLFGLIDIKHAFVMTLTLLQNVRAFCWLPEGDYKNDCDVGNAQLSLYRSSDHHVPASCEFKINCSTKRYIPVARPPGEGFWAPITLYFPEDLLLTHVYGSAYGLSQFAEDDILKWEIVNPADGELYRRREGEIISTIPNHCEPYDARPQPKGYTPPRKCDFKPQYECEDVPKSSLKELSSKTTTRPYRSTDDNLRGVKLCVTTSECENSNGRECPTTTVAYKRFLSQQEKERPQQEKDNKRKREL